MESCDLDEEFFLSYQWKVSIVSMHVNISLGTVV